MEMVNNGGRRKLFGGIYSTAFGPAPDKTCYPLISHNFIRRLFQGFGLSCCRLRLPPTRKDSRDCRCCCCCIVRKRSIETRNSPSTPNSKIHHNAHRHHLQAARLSRPPRVTRRPQICLLPLLCLFRRPGIKATMVSRCPSRIAAYPRRLFR